MLVLINSTARELSPRTPRGSGRIRRAVKGLSLDGVPRPLSWARRAETGCRLGPGAQCGKLRLSRRMKATCRPAGREDGAPHRLYLKTKDPLSGSDSGLWFSNDSTPHPPTLPGGWGFRGDCCDRLFVVGVLRALCGRAEGRAVMGASPQEGRRHDREAMRPLTAHRRRLALCARARGHASGAGKRSTRRLASRL